MRDNPGNTPAKEALMKLLEGNLRFASGQSKHALRHAHQREQTLNEQSPMVAILSCSDSHVPPEVIFDQSIGDIYTIRTAGHVVDNVVIGSIEFAVELLGIQLVLVLGHQNCEAVTATVEVGDTTGHITDLIDKISRVMDDVFRMEGDIIANAIDIHIKMTVNTLRTSQPILDKLYQKGSVKIGGARYDMDSGKVVLV